MFGWDPLSREMQTIHLLQSITFSISLMPLYWRAPHFGKTHSAIWVTLGPLDIGINWNDLPE